MRLLEEHGVVYVLQPGDHQAGADGDSFSMENYRHATIIILIEDITTAGPEVKVYSGATAGTKTTAETFKVRKSSADFGTDGADLFGAESSSADYSLVHSDDDDRMLVIDIDAADLTEGQPWVTLNVDADADEFTAAAVAILSQPRYRRNAMPTAIS